MIHKIVWFIFTLMVLSIALEISIFLYFEGHGWINPDRIPGLLYQYFERDQCN